MNPSIWVWLIFNVFVLVMLALDLGVFHRSAHKVGLREAAIWSGVWVAVSVAFGAGLWYFSGSEPAIAFFTGYVLEKSLAVDNIFVFVLVFAFFGVPAALQHRVLVWGVIGAIIMRGLMIGLGAYLIERFHWILYVFGAFLIVTGIRMALDRGVEGDPTQNPVLRLVRRAIPVSDGYHGSKFFVRNSSKLVATPLLVALIAIEVSDLIFAVDSIPAVFAVTQDPFLVYTSNILAILGLRAMYFLLAGVIERFHLLQIGLAVVLTFVGAKMLLESVYAIPTLVALAVVLVILSGSVVASLIWPRGVSPHAELRRPDIPTE